MKKLDLEIWTNLSKVSTLVNSKAKIQIQTVFTPYKHYFMKVMTKEKKKNFQLKMADRTHISIPPKMELKWQ